MIVVIKRIKLVVNVGYKEVLPPVLIVVPRINPHSGTGVAIHAVSNACQHTVFLELSMLIYKKKVLHRVIGNKQIHPAVIVNIGGHHPPSFTQVLLNSGTLADVGEGAIAIIVKKPAWGGLINAWYAVVSFALFRISAIFIFRFVVVYESAHEEIEPSIIVIIEPYCARGPSWSSDSSRTGAELSAGEELCKGRGQTSACAQPRPQQLHR